MSRPDDFFDFVRPSKESFLKSRAYVIQHKDYNPYSDDLSVMDGWLKQGEFEQVASYSNINILLSPSAHFLKKIAFEKLDEIKGAKAEDYMCVALLECLRLSGNGTLEAPYIVTRISDELDLLSYLNLQKGDQALILHEDRHLDRIEVSSGKYIYFDITDCFRSLSWGK